MRSESDKLQNRMNFIGSDLDAESVFCQIWRSNRRLTQRCCGVRLRPPEGRTPLNYVLWIMLEPHLTGRFIRKRRLPANKLARIWKKKNKSCLRRSGRFVAASDTAVVTVSDRRSHYILLVRLFRRDCCE